MGTETTITIDSKPKKWRFECPRGDEPGEGHDNWYLWDGVFCCETCKSHRNSGEDVQSVYECLRDKKTGELVPRERLEITADARDSATAAGD